MIIQHPNKTETGFNPWSLDRKALQQPVTATNDRCYNVYHGTVV